MTHRERRRAEDDAAREWNGGYRPYDLVKEASIALGVALALLLTILFSSPTTPRARSSSGRAPTRWTS
jgi:hypothetical protein